MGASRTLLNKQGRKAGAFALVKRFAPIDRADRMAGKIAPRKMRVQALATMCISSALRT